MQLSAFIQAIKLPESVLRLKLSVTTRRLLLKQMLLYSLCTEQLQIKTFDHDNKKRRNKLFL